MSASDDWLGDWRDNGGIDWLDDAAPDPLPISAPEALSGGEMRRVLVDYTAEVRKAVKKDFDDITDAEEDLCSERGEVAEAVDLGHMIWLGDLPVDIKKLEKDAQRGLSLFAEQLINHPFGDTPYVFAANFVFVRDGVMSRTGVITVAAPNDNWGPDSETGETPRGLVLDTYLPARYSDGLDLELANSTNCGLYLSGWRFGPNGEPHAGAVGSTLAIGLWGYGLQMINTENVPIEKVVTSPKLAKARARNRKPQLPDYYVVQSREYVTTLARHGRVEAAPAGGGTHASPIAHVRRGHKRYIGPDRERFVWVRDCLVGARKVPIEQTAQRLFYDASKLPR